MPCTDGGMFFENTVRTRNGLTIDQIEAILCGVLTALDTVASTNPGAGVNGVFDNIDWKEVGVTRRQGTSWWKKHKAADELRRKREEQIRADRERKNNLKRSALKKLTPAERAALNL